MPVGNRLKHVWIIIIPILNRGINFLVLPFTFHQFNAEEFICISYYTLLITGASVVYGMGIGPKILAATVKHRSQNYQLLMSSVITCTLIFTPTFFFSQYFHLNEYIFNSIFTELIFSIALLEAFIMAISGEIFSASLQGQDKLKTLSNLNLALTILQGPVRIYFLISSNLSVGQWLILGLVFRIIILILSIYYTLNKLNANKAAKHGIHLMFGKWNFFILYPIIFWLSGNLDRFVAIDKFTSIENSVYQVSYQLSSVLGLLLAQLTISCTQFIYTSINEIGPPQNLNFLTGFISISVIFTYPLFVVFELMVNQVSKNDVLALMILLISQLAWGLVQVKQLQIGAFLGLSHRLPIPAILSLLTLILFFMALVNSNSIIFIAILPVFFYLGVLFFIRVIFGKKSQISSMRFDSKTLKTLSVLIILTLAIPYIIPIQNLSYVFPLAYLVGVLTIRNEIWIFMRSLFVELV